MKLVIRIIFSGKKPENCNWNFHHFFFIQPAICLCGTLSLTQISLVAIPFWSTQSDWQKRCSVHHRRVTTQLEWSVLGMLSIRIARYKNTLAWAQPYSYSERGLYSAHEEKHIPIIWNWKRTLSHLSRIVFIKVRLPPTCALKNLVLKNLGLLRSTFLSTTIKCIEFFIKSGTPSSNLRDRIALDHYTCLDLLQNHYEITRIWKTLE